MVGDSTGIDNEVLIAAFLRAHRERWRPTTTRLRRIQLHALGRQLGTPLVSVTEEELLAWRDDLHDRQQASPETIKAYVCSARGLYGWMSSRARPRYRPDDPSVCLEVPRIPSRPPRPMLDRHFDIALSAALSDAELFCWLCLAGCSGLRCCEIAWLQTHDVEEIPGGGAWLHLEGKGGKRRTTAAGAALMGVLRPFVSRGVRGPVFTRPSDGRAHTPNRVSAIINQHLRSLGIHETAHTLRHRFGTDYHVLDPDLFRQASVMGHASVDMTRRYTEVSPAETGRHIDELTARRIGRMNGAA